MVFSKIREVVLILESTLFKQENLETLFYDKL